MKLERQVFLLMFWALFALLWTHHFW